jgi:hypothetical protein
VDSCPSIQSLVDRNKKIYRYYCEHCYWLYAYSLEKHGYHYEEDYSLQEDGKPVNRCYFKAYGTKVLQPVQEGCHVSDT